MDLWNDSRYALVVCNHIIKDLFKSNMPVVCRKNDAVKLISCFGVDGMNNVTENTVFVLAAGHSCKHSVIALYDLNIVYSKTVVDGNGYDCLEIAFGEGLSDLYLSDFHCGFPPFLNYLGFSRNQQLPALPLFP